MSSFDDLFEAKSTLFKKENTEMEDHPSPDAGNVDYRVLEREAQK